MPQFFVTSNLINNNQIKITGHEHHHLYKVLRKKQGDIINVFDEKGQGYVVRIISIDESCLICEILQRQEKTKVLPITLYQCLPKARKMDIIVEKATELGVTKIVPVVSKYTEVKGDITNKIERWRRITKSASKQSGNILTEIHPNSEKIEHIIKTENNDHLKLIAYELGNKSLKEILQKIKSPKGISLIIGPEGGLSKEEVTFSILNNWQSFKLPGNILRVETAPISIISIINYVFN